MNRDARAKGTTMPKPLRPLPVAHGSTVLVGGVFAYAVPRPRGSAPIRVTRPYVAAGRS